MKRFEDLISQSSWMFVFIGFTPMFLILLHPSVTEIGVFWLADYLALLATHWLDRRVFPGLFPDTADYFCENKQSEIAEASLEKKNAIFQSMIRFPKKRALYAFAMCFVKAIPAFLVIIFFWKHENSHLEQFITLFCMLGLMYSYFYGVVFIENHIFVSQKLSEFHLKYDWGEVFRNREVHFQNKTFELEETISFSLIAGFMLSLQWILAMRQPTGPYSLGLQILTVGFAGITFIFWIWYLRRKFYAASLETLFKALEELNLESKAPTLPLNSSPTIAYFQQVFNTMTSRLRGYQNELYRWVFYQTEESRYRALGEISALVVHDLSAPLQVINFCAEELQSKPDLLMRDKRYLEYLALNGKKSIELVDSLKTYLKSSNQTTAWANYYEGHDHVVRLLKTQFYSLGLSPVTFQLDPVLKRLQVGLNKADFIHILLNLFRNSFDDFLRNKQKNCTIQVQLLKDGDGRVSLGIQDNGSGLTKEKFESLTSMMISPEGKFERGGLGLRLVRRLIERNEGSLEVVELEGKSGTFYCLKLKGFVQPEISSVLPAVEKHENHLDH